MMTKIASYILTDGLMRAITAIRGTWGTPTKDQLDRLHVELNKSATYNAVAKPDMEALEKEILRRLNHAIQRDRDKGGTGTRSTHDLAEGLDLSTSQVRGILRKLSARRLVNEFDVLPIEWAITHRGRATLKGATE